MVTRAQIDAAWDKIHVFNGPTYRDVLSLLAQNEVGWNDNLTSFTGIQAQGTRIPSWEEIGSTGIYGWFFEAQANEVNEQELTLAFHIGHDLAIDENGFNAFEIFPHVHWHPEDNAAGTVRWLFDYIYSHGHRRGALPASATQIVVEDATDEEAWTHIITEPTDGNGIPAGTVETDGILLCHFRRNSSHANDTYAGDILGTYGDLHYVRDRDSTPNRAPPFYS